LLTRDLSAVALVLKVVYHDDSGRPDVTCVRGK
jgi:hypothetical protein